MVTHEVVADAVAGSRGRQREAVKSIVGSRGTRETPAGMSNDIRALDPYALSVAPFMAQVLLTT